MVGNLLRSKLISLGEDVDSGCGNCLRILSEMDKWGANGCAEKQKRKWLEQFIEVRFAKAIKGKYTGASLLTEVLRESGYVPPPPIAKIIPPVVPRSTNPKPTFIQAKPYSNSPTAMKWVYGVTTVPERINHHLPKTLNSLLGAGFGNPRLFVDGGDEQQYQHFGLQITNRNPKVRAYANWVLSLTELFYRNPDAQRYAIFQDDIVLVKNLRPYLDLIPFPQKGYLNLTTIWESEDIAKEYNPAGIAPASPQKLNNGQPKRANTVGVIPQHGRGALALVFDREGVLALLSHPHMTNRVVPDRPGYDPNRCYRLIDGAVVEAMNASGYTEYIHNPSLVQHAGPTSTITGRTWGAKAISRSFPGEQFNCLSLLDSLQPTTV